MKPEANMPNQLESFARIKVVGVGGGGCNAVDRIHARSRGSDASSLRSALKRATEAYRRGCGARGRSRSESAGGMRMRTVSPGEGLRAGR